MKDEIRKAIVGDKIKKTISNIQKEINIVYWIRVLQSWISKMVWMPLWVIKSPYRYSYNTLVWYLIELRKFDFYKYMSKRFKSCKIQ